MLASFHNVSDAGHCVVLILGVAWSGWVLRWLFKEGPVSPDPWDTEIEAKIHSSEAVPVCHQCFAQNAGHEHFCSECGTAIGTYNNWLPYDYIFSVGEMFRRGTSGKFAVRPFTTTGYLVMSVAEYGFFAPIYWFFLFRNIKKISQEKPLLIEDSGTEVSL